jgi:hypothetical protein
LSSEQRGKAPRLPRQEAYTLRSLDQIKVLADPLRIRVLEAFCQERTTKQVAQLLREKATKLYHHVDALERVGLIALSRTRQNRGTVEKYYLAVARTFRADSRAFQPKDKGRNEKSGLRQMISTIFDTTSAELASLADQGGDVELATLDDQGADPVEPIEEAMVSFLEIRASKAQLKEIRGKLNEIVRSLTAVAEGSTESEDDSEHGRYRLTLAYYPLVEAEPGSRRKK